MEEIIIYTNETCNYCKQIKEELTKANIEFKERLTSDFKDEWQDITNLTAIPSIPTIHYKENYFVPGRDFNNAAHLINIINEFKQCSFSLDFQTVEKIKSLNYNIHMAFGRIDQILRQIETKLNTEEDVNKSTD